jgi:transcriptional regulator with XRE-family HTH domain
MTTTHWTDRTPEDFLYSIASDFIEQLRAKMTKIGMSQSKLAKAAKVSKGYVSQVFNDPGNLTLVTIVKFAKAAGMKVSVVGYEDDPKIAGSGPVNAEVFRICWERQGKPIDMWSLKEQRVAATPNRIDVKNLLENFSLGREILLTEIKPVMPSPHGNAAFQISVYVNEKSKLTLTGKGLSTYSTLGEE